MSPLRDLLGIEESQGLLGKKTFESSPMNMKTNENFSD